MRTDPDVRVATAAWQWLPLRLTLAAIPLWLTAAALIFHDGWAAHAVIVLTLGATLASPVHGLLLTSVVAPLGQLLAALTGDETFRIGEAVVVSFLAGWLVRGPRDRPGPTVAAPAIGWIFAATVVSSVGALAWHHRAYPGEYGITLRHLEYTFYSPTADWIGEVTGARLLEGLGLVAATVTLFRSAPWLANALPSALAVSATVAAASSELLSRHIGTAGALKRFALNAYRVSGHVADVNAAGSYFAMCVCLAIGMAWYARGKARALWLMATVAIGIGLRLSQSKSAFAAVALVAIIAAAAVATGRLTRRARIAVLAGVVVLAAAGAALRVRQLDSDPGFRGAGFREQFNATSARMIQARPAAGIGIGQYYRTSPAFLSPQLAFAYGFENAHNNFLQVGAELGLVGLTAFVIWIGAPVARSARALLRTPYDWRLLGAVSGILAFLGTCLTGHPLLVSEVAYPFWILFGFVTALAGSTLLRETEAPSRIAPNVGSGGLWKVVATATAALIVAGLQAGSKRTLAPPETRAIDGLYEWQTASDGRRFRWTEEFASIIVPREIGRVRVPVRVPTDRPPIAPMVVEWSIAGSRPERTLIGGSWTILDFPLSDTDSMMRVKRVNLKIERTWQPALYIAGDSEMRWVGIQVGEPDLERAR